MSGSSSAMHQFALWKPRPLGHCRLVGRYRKRKTRRNVPLGPAHEHHGGTSAPGRLVYVFVLGGQWMLQAFDLDLANCGAQYWPGQTGRRRLVLPMGGRGLLALQLMVEQVLAMNC